MLTAAALILCCTCAGDTPTGNTPVHYVMSGGRGSMFKNLYPHFRDIGEVFEIVNSKGQNLLHCAVENNLNWEAVILKLLDHDGTDVNCKLTAVDSDLKSATVGDTPLLRAIRKKNATLAREFIKMEDCDLKQRNSNNETVLMAACEEKLEHIALLLLGTRTACIFCSDADVLMFRESSNSERTRGR